MEPKRYNQYGIEITDPLYYIDRTTGLIIDSPYTQNQIRVYHSPEQSLVDFVPSDNFGLKITRDADSNVNINLKFNPKRFFAFATETITSVVMLKKAFSGLL